jgi:DNA-binding winged helix-turn-helix (wHTH) protein
MRASSAGSADDPIGRSGVAVLHWPAQAGEVAALAEQGRPRLLLVSPDADPPVSDDWREEWIRMPADERDVAARVLRLTGRVDRQPALRLDDSGRLIVGDRWVALSPIESRLAGALLEHYGEVVSDAELVERGWPDDGPADRKRGTGALRVHVTRLRRRVAPLALEIRAVRAQGFILQAARPDPSGTPGSGWAPDSDKSPSGGQEAPAP